MRSLKNWDVGTSILHLGLAVGVTLQLFVALVMHGHHWIFVIHEWVGAFLILVVLAQWAWILWIKPENMHHLFPWDPAGLRAVKNDLQNLLKGQLPEGGAKNKGGLPGFICGLGFIAVTGMALSGLLIFIGFQLHMNPHFFKKMHSGIANFVWVYWVGHVAMAITHRFFDKQQPA